jgi:GDP-mannose 4,6 dehydratase
VEILLGDASKARQRLGWTPETSFEALVAEMVREDLRWVGREAEGHRREHGGAMPALAAVDASERLM